MCQIAVNFRFFMPFNFGWKAYFSARSRGVGLLFFCPRPGRGAQHPTCLQKFLPFSKTGELAISNLRFRPISPAKVSCGAEKQELKGGLTRYRPTALDSFVRGELHGSRQPYQRGVPRLPAALFKGQNFEQKKSSPFSRKTLILAGLQGFEP